MYAYQRCKANGGAAGVDNQTLEDIEQHGVERWLDELAQELEKSNLSTATCAAGIHTQAGWEAEAVRYVPTIRDRVVETAAMSVLEPIFEADLQPEQYAYRADRSALDAVKQNMSIS